MSVWFRAAPGRPAAPDATLICLPHAGGGASLFRDWTARLAPAIDTLAVQYPGHEGRWREPLARELEEIVTPLAHAIASDVRTRVALFGHSLGALVAFELAHALRRLGEEYAPLHLFVSGSRAPHLAIDHPPAHVFDAAAFLRYVRDLGGLPDEVMAHEGLMSVLLPVIRNDLRIDETYFCPRRAPLACPLTVIDGTDDPDVSRDAAEAWRRHTAGPFVLMERPGGHFWTHAGEEVMLAAIRAGCLDSAAGARRADAPLSTPGDAASA